MEVCGLIYSTFICLSFIEACRAIECYHCHQTSKDCINGVKNKIYKTDCPEEKCFVLKYETDMPGVTVQAAYRGCFNMPRFKDLMQSVTTPNHTTRHKQFNLCNNTLCNSAWKIGPSYFLTLFVLYPVYIT